MIAPRYIPTLSRHIFSSYAILTSFLIFAFTPIFELEYIILDSLAHALTVLKQVFLLTYFDYLFHRINTILLLH